MPGADARLVCDVRAQAGWQRVLKKPTSFPWPASSPVRLRVAAESGPGRRCNVRALAKTSRRSFRRNWTKGITAHL